MRRPSGPITDVAAATALLLAVGCALAAVLAQGGRFSSKLDLLTHFAPFYLVGAILAALLALVAGQRLRTVTLGLSLVAFVGAAALIAPEFLRSAGPRAAANTHGQIKVIQFNLSRTNPDLPRVVDWLVAQNPDIVTITEASPAVRDALVKRTGWRVAGAKGDLMIFSREKRIKMDRHRGYENRLNWVNATYPSVSGPYEIMTAHLRWPNWPEIRDQEKILGALVSYLPRDRTILTGDLNSTPWSFARQDDDRTLGLIRRDRALSTWPARRSFAAPFLPIDHIYAGPGWATVKVERGPYLGSDHYPLVVVLAPVSPAPVARR